MLNCLVDLQNCCTFVVLKNNKKNAPHFHNAVHFKQLKNKLLLNN
jgi:hypothetical protein